MARPDPEVLRRTPEVRFDPESLGEKGTIGVLVFWGSERVWQSQTEKGRMIHSFELPRGEMEMGLACSQTERERVLLRASNFATYVIEITSFACEKVV